jgi:hypothetical protein
MQRAAKKMDLDRIDAVTKILQRVFDDVVVIVREDMYDITLFMEEEEYSYILFKEEISLCHPNEVALRIYEKALKK